ncbi:MAG: hypothetical protein JXP34_04725 [Planctomycetes bacterium]|nr:hypothetical protein [Planctomycetota bacterium]
MDEIVLTVERVCGKGGDVHLFRGPFHNWMMTPDELERLKVASRRVAEAAVKQESASDFRAALGDLNSEFEGCLGVLGKLAAGRTVIHVRPEGDEAGIWRDIEGIAWEAGLIGMAEPGSTLGVIRTFGDTSVEPFPWTRGVPKILFIACTPWGRSPRLETRKGIDAIQRVWQDRIVRPTVRIVENADTLEEIERIGGCDPQWDMIHVIAHGCRDGREGPAILLEGPALPDRPGGSDRWVPVARFADALARFEGVRLITLHVCDSSPLAIALMARLSGRTRVVGFLHKATEEIVFLFFERLYREILRTRLGAEAGENVTIEEAFLKAVRSLLDRHSPEWCLPVLYAPRTMVSLFVAGSDPETMLREIVDPLVDNWGDERLFDESLRRLEGFFGGPNVVLADAAAKVHKILNDLRDIEHNFRELLEGIRLCRDWGSLETRWKDRAIRERRVAHAEGVEIASPVDRFGALFLSVEKLDALARKAIDAVRELAAFERGAAGGLLKGCALLREVFFEREEERKAIPLQVYRAGVESKLAALEDAGEADRPDAELVRKVREIDVLVAKGKEFLPPDAVRILLDRTAKVLDVILQPIDRALEAAASSAAVEIRLERILEAVERLTGLAGEKELPPGMSDLLRGRITAARECVAAVPIPSSGPGAELLDPGRRLDLQLWCKGRRGAHGPDQGAPLAEIPDRPADLVSFVRDLRGRISGAGSGLWSTCPPERVPLLANETAPLFLVANLERAAHPYLVLHSLGIHPDLDTIHLRDAGDARIQEERDPFKLELYRQALSELCDDRRRVCVDVLLAPCRDREALARSFRPAADAILAGGEPPASIFEELDPMDRATLRAVLGQPDRVLAEAWEALKQDPEDWERVRHAFLVAAYAAERQRQDPERFQEAMRQVFALHGMMPASSEPLDRWIRMRFAVYQRITPEDTQDLVSAIRHALQNHVDRILTDFERGGEQHRAAARALRAEWKAELEGARLAASISLRLQGGRLVGGYLAGRMRGILKDIGTVLAKTYAHIRQLTSELEVQYAGATGMTRVLCDQLIIAFSELRLAVADLPAAAERLAPLVPAPGEQMGPELPSGVRDLIGAKDFDLRFPTHAALDPSVRETALAAHAARVHVDGLLARTKRLLDSERPERVEVIRNLDGIAWIESYGLYANLETVSPGGSRLKEIEELLCGWVESMLSAIREAAGKSETPDLDRMRETLAALEPRIRLADALAGTGPYGNEIQAYRKALAELHVSIGVALANHFNEFRVSLSHVRAAYGYEPGERRVVINLLRACLHAGCQFREEGRIREARAVFEEGERAGRRLRGEHAAPDTELDEAQAALKKLLRELDEPQEPGGLAPAIKVD